MRRVAPFLIALAWLAGCTAQEARHDADRVVSESRHVGDTALDVLSDLFSAPPSGQ